MESIWSKTTNLDDFPSLPGDLTADAVVIGGGLAGVLTAYFLKERNVKTILLEAAKIGSGQTRNTTAKITSQHNIVYSKITKEFGEEKAKQYAAANERAIKEYKRIIEEKNIDCSFIECPAYLYSRSPLDVIKMEQETKAAENLGIRAEFVTDTSLPFPVAGAVKFYDQAQFHPLKFLQAISKDIEIYENSKVKTVEDDSVITENGTVRAKHIVFATHFPFINVPGFYFARMHQERSYVLALENAAQLDGMYLGIDADGLSFRNYHDILLLGGGGHRTGDNPEGGKYDFLREMTAKYYPQSRETLHWSAQDCITLDGIPFIGRFSAMNPNWYVATGFAKWGMTSSMVSAMIIADMITEIKNPCLEVFSPLRFKPSASIKTLVADMGESVKGLTKQVFSIPSSEIEALPRGEGRIMKYNDQKAGVYKDENNEIHIVSTRCPHLGCQLEWNPDEKSWDCPCHGSRFDYNGRLLSNPAQTDLEIFENK